MVTMFVFSLKNLISFHCLSIDSLTSKQFAQKLINDFTSQEEERVNTSGSNGCSNNVSIISKSVIQSRKSSFLIIKKMTYWTRRALLANCLSVWCEMGFQIISIQCSTTYTADAKIYWYSNLNDDASKLRCQSSLSLTRIETQRVDGLRVKVEVIAPLTVIDKNCCTQIGKSTTTFRTFDT